MHQDLRGSSVTLKELLVRSSRLWSILGYVTHLKQTLLSWRPSFWPLSVCQVAVHASIAFSCNPSLLRCLFAKRDYICGAVLETPQGNRTCNGPKPLSRTRNHRFARRGQAPCGWLGA